MTTSTGRIARTPADVASDQFRTTLNRLGGVLESKYNFDPNQPRRPKGTVVGGQWAPGLSPPGSAEAARLGRAIAEGDPRVDAFLRKHEKTITRLLGATQALAGGIEFVGGVALGAGGSATSEVGVGIPVALVGGWMVKNGYDNASTGWRALVTGEPQETGLHQALRGLGLKEDAATAVELLLSGGGIVGGASVGRKALNRAAIAELERRTARAFDPRFAVSVRTSRGSLWDEVDIRVRGEAWEKFDVKRTGYSWYPNAKTFDQISSDESVAISNKTLDLMRETYLKRDRRALYHTLKKYIDLAAEFTPISARTGVPMVLRKRRLHLLLRFGDSVAAQALQIAAAEQYAISRGVILQVEYGF